MKIHRSLAVGLGLALVAPLVAPGTGGAESPQAVATAKADLWLRTQQQVDGGFEVAGFPGFETPDAVLALGAVGDGAWDRGDALAYVEAATEDGVGPLDAIDDLIDDEATPTSVAAGARAAKIAALVVDHSKEEIAVTNIQRSADAAALAAARRLNGRVDGWWDAKKAAVAAIKRNPIHGANNEALATVALKTGEPAFWDSKVPENILNSVGKGQAPPAYNSGIEGKGAGIDVKVERGLYWRDSQKLDHDWSCLICGQHLKSCHLRLIHGSFQKISTVEELSLQTI